MFWTRRIVHTGSIPPNLSPPEAMNRIIQARHLYPAQVSHFSNTCSSSLNSSQVLTRFVPFPCLMIY